MARAVVVGFEPSPEEGLLVKRKVFWALNPVFVHAKPGVRVLV